MTSPPRYRIAHVGDFLAVPPARLPDCLSEFAAGVLDAVSRAASPSPGGPVRLEDWTWIDDGTRETRVYLDGREVAPAIPDDRPGAIVAPDTPSERPGIPLRMPRPSAPGWLAVESPESPGRWFVVDVDPSAETNTHAIEASGPESRGFADRVADLLNQHGWEAKGGPR